MGLSEKIPFEEALISVSVGKLKIKESEYDSTGCICVVDQGQNLVSGMTNRADLKRDDGPYIVFGDHTRIVKFINFPFVVGADGVRLYKASEKYEPEFLYLFLKSSKLPEDGYGRHSKHLKELLVPEISKEKQRQIAARLKAQLAEVDKARQAAEAQLREAHTLYAAVLKETFLNGASETWPRVELGEVGDVVAGVTLGRKTNGKATRPIPYLRVANVKDGHLDLSDVSTIEATETEIKRLLLQPGDILLTEGGDPDKLGRGTFWNGELEECIHQNHIFRVRFPPESYLPEFIAAQIGSTYGKNYFFAHAKKTTGIATINQKVLKSFPVLSPTIEVQKGVMATLNSQLGETGKIIQSATKQLNDINLLPQKILAQAFEGEKQ